LDSAVIATTAVELKFSGNPLLDDARVETRVSVGPVDEYVQLPTSNFPLGCITEIESSSPLTTPAAENDWKPTEVAPNVIAPVPGEPTTVIFAISWSGIIYSPVPI
jgi:hypothetical protein